METALLDTAITVSPGASGGGITIGGVTAGGTTNGVTVVLDAPLPFTEDATVEMTYEVPPTRPVIVQEETATTVHDALPGVTRATYVVFG